MEKKRKITEMHIRYISLVKSPANMEKVILKDMGSAPDFQRYVKFTKEDLKKHILYGIVYAPGEVDAQGDYADEETIRKAAYEFMKNAYTNNVDSMHSFMPQDTYVAESWIVKEKDALFSKKGAWAVGVKIDDPEIWKACENGQIKGLSMAGQGKVEVIRKSAIPYKKMPLADAETPWNFDAAKVDTKVLALISAYIDDNYSENDDGLYPKAAYKLPHHESEAPFRTVLKGVQAAGAAIMGSRGGVKIPSEDLPAVKSHLEKHYHEFGKKAPWEEENIMQKFVKFFKKEELTMDEKMKKEVETLIKEAIPNILKDNENKKKKEELSEFERLKKDFIEFKKKIDDSEKADILRKSVSDLEGKIKDIKKAKEKGDKDGALDLSLTILEKQLKTIKGENEENTNLEKEISKLKQELEIIRKNTSASQQSRKIENEHNDFEGIF